MKRILVFLLLLPALSLAIDFEEADKLIKPYDEATISYLNERMEYENSIPLDERDGCYALPGGGITQIIRINQDGIIDLVVSNLKNERSECFRKTYLGSKFKAPPKAPIFIKQRMGYATPQ